MSKVFVAVAVVKTAVVTRVFNYILDVTKVLAVDNTNSLF